ncbi:hypothetical protein ACET3Z_010625 [Daucus carota]
MARPKKGRNPPPPPPATAAEAASHEGESGDVDSELIFSDNNNVVFPTSEDRRNPFRIDFGERVYNLDEKCEKRVLRVSEFSWDLEQYLKKRSEMQIFRFHGGIKAISNITRELMKGIVASFCTLIKETPENEVMYLHNHSNYLLHGVEPYCTPPGTVTRNQQIIANLDISYCPPIQVIIVKDNKSRNKSGTRQTSLPEKVEALSKVLKEIYGEEEYSCDRNEWLHFYNRLVIPEVPLHIEAVKNKAPPGMDDAALNALIKDSIDGLERHHVFWHWTDKDGFIEYFDSLLSDEKFHNLVVPVFDQFHFFETDWETEFTKDPPMKKCYDTKLMHDGGTVAPTQGATPAPSPSLGGSGGFSGGAHALAQSTRRRRGGIKFITKTRNCIGSGLQFILKGDYGNGVRQSTHPSGLIGPYRGWEPFIGSGKVIPSDKEAARFALLWNKIINCFREKDLINRK